MLVLEKVKINYPYKSKFEKAFLVSKIKNKFNL